MKTILMLLSSAPASDHAAGALQLARLLKQEGYEVTVFLLQDAVLGALSAQDTPTGNLVAKAMAAGIGFLCLDEDLSMRGYTADELLPQIRLADYSSLVDLMMDGHDRVLGIF
jgi:sulfur relay protein TusB/DsrH